ncbi:hypothetical protein [Haloplanus halobius]|uniref:hypothetical protein n=1 Tax=Haloplanus halobius TaxID=2934938 RepID=UPI00200C74FA|nr:hypothetical protein [Haloplanus sp. XH21]
MTVVSTIGRGAASGLAGVLIWTAVAVLVLDTVDPRRALAVGVAIGVAVTVVAAIDALR